MSGESSAMPSTNRELRVLVRGIGDVASAVAHRLFRVGHPVVIHTDPRPTITRRGMAFADAVFDGEAILEGVHAVRVDEMDAVREVLAAGVTIPVVVGQWAALFSVVRPHVLIDARMRKREHPERQRGLAPLTIGLGPNFVAGETTDVVVETSWVRLGEIVTRGASLPLQGEPRPIAGHARDRYVYAPVGGTFHTGFEIGDRVQAGEVVARIDDAPLAAPLDGVLRGLTRDGVPVSPGTKIIEVDPRVRPELVRGIGERPARIAEGVLHALERTGRMS